MLLRRLKERDSPLVMQAWMAVFGIPFLFLVSLIFESGQVTALLNAPWQAFAALAYTVVAASLIGHSFYYILVQRYEVSLVTAVLLPSPAIGVLGGVALLGEPLTPLIVLGSVMTIAGVFIVLRRNDLRVVPQARRR